MSSLKKICKILFLQNNLKQLKEKFDQRKGDSLSFFNLAIEKYY